MKFMAGIVVLALTLGGGAVADDERPKEEKPDLAAIQAKSLAMLREVVPNTKRKQSPKTELETPDGRACWGNFWGTGEMLALVTLQPKEDPSWDAGLPWHLSFLVWKNGQWEYRQLLGSARYFSFHERKDLGLRIVQGSCPSGRFEAVQSSWFYDAKAQRFKPTGLDEWGPYYIKGNYICYNRGAERKAHWSTTWVYPFVKGKKGKLLACSHSDDQDRFAISFTGGDGSSMVTWAFKTDPEKPSEVTVLKGREETDLGGESIGKIKLSEGHGLIEGACFERLTGLSVDLLIPGWTDKVAKPANTVLSVIEVTGDAAVVARFQKPGARKKS